MLNSEEIKPVAIALAIIKLCLSERISKAVSQLLMQSVDNSNKFLKSVVTCFGVIFLGKESLTSMIPI